MEFTEEYLKNKMKGLLAEELFLLMHLELGCQVYRTGHEFLYPYLFQVANTKRKVSHYNNKEKDKLSFPHFPETEKNKIVGDLRFAKSDWGFNVSSSPDFTIVTPTGFITQVEVKFRKDGILTKDEFDKYLTLKPAPLIFMVMNKEPYFKFFYPNMHYVELNEEEEEVLNKYLELIEKYPGVFFIDSNKPEEEAHSDFFERVKEFNVSREDLEILSKCMHIISSVKEKGEEEKVFSNKYTEIKPISLKGDMSISFPNSLTSDILMYPANLLNKYKSLVRDYFYKDD